MKKANSIQKRELYQMVLRDCRYVRVHKGCKTGCAGIPQGLIPADGLYEWMRTGKAKQPNCFEIGEGELFGFAELWERWKAPTGQWIKSCSILTTTPNAVTAPVHDRMPVILDPDGYEIWLDPGMTNAAAASELLKPYDAQLMRCYPINTRINHVANDDEECCQPVEVAQIQDRLFL
jgi:putative SOS response-associated peptidase YedK